MGVSVEFEKLVFAYGRHGHRLHDVSLSIEPGEFCCLLGPNGAGKTTLLRCLLGLLTPQAGTIRVLGRDIGEFSARERARTMAYVPQSTSTPFTFTVLDMTVMGRTAHIGTTASPSQSDRRAALAQLERLGIDHLAHRAFTSLSGGEKQLTLLGRALLQEAAVLVLDEPTSSLDYGNEIRFLRIVEDIVEEHRAVLMTTHQPLNALRHAQRAVLMREGRIIGNGAPADVMTGEALTRLYGVDIEVTSVQAVNGDGRTQRICFPSEPDPG